MKGGPGGESEIERRVDDIKLNEANYISAFNQHNSTR